ncbi:hypothetical protein ABT341_00335 [Pseudonocardia alni]|uniref:hypothetical protein n=1 Tax=Pseudonocardia alni TaxID=33907 RepID=UPI00331C4767
MTTTSAPAAPFRYLGITDECVKCERCGKAELKSTVVLAILDADGNVDAVTYYGSSCAARALSLGRGGARKVLDDARAAHRDTIARADDARRMLAARGWTADAAPAGTDLDVAAYKRNVHVYHYSPHLFADLNARGWAGWRQDVLDSHARMAAAIRDAALLGL